jgi:hypothetical protein
MVMRIDAKPAVILGGREGVLSRTLAVFVSPSRISNHTCVRERLLIARRGLL